MKIVTIESNPLASIFSRSGEEAALLKMISQDGLYFEDGRGLSPSVSRSTLRPGNLDVLCGRGRGFFEHPGNRRMLSIIAPFKEGYQMASKVEKTMIVQRVLELILHPNNGDQPRFLRNDSDKKTKKGSCWCVLEEKEVTKKIAHTLREQKTIVKPSTKEMRKNLSTKRTSFVQKDEDDETQSSTGSALPLLDKDNLPCGKDQGYNFPTVGGTTPFSDCVVSPLDLIFQDVNQSTTNFGFCSGVPVSDNEDNIPQQASNTLYQDEPLHYENDSWWSSTMEDISALESFLEIMRQAV